MSRNFQGNVTLLKTNRRHLHYAIPKVILSLCSSLAKERTIGQSKACFEISLGKRFCNQGPLRPGENGGKLCSRCHQQWRESHKALKPAPFIVHHIFCSQGTSFVIRFIYLYFKAEISEVHPKCMQKDMTYYQV